MKHIILSIAILVASFAFADTSIVAGGKPTDNCLFNASAWKETAEGLHGAGPDNPVCSTKVFESNELVISATLYVESFNGCAPRFTVGDVNCGFDGGSGDYFIEQLNGSPHIFSKTIAPIEAKKPFTVTINCNSGRLKYHVNGTLVGEFVYSQGKQLSVTFNPWRATATLQEFSVIGKENGSYVPPKRKERCAELVSIHGNSQVDIPIRLPQGRYFAQICEGDSVLSECDVECDGASKITFPNGVLKGAYAKSRAAFNVRPLDVFLYKSKIASNRHEFVMMLHDPQAQIVPAKGELKYRNGIGAFVINGVDVGTFSGTLGNMGTQAAGYDLGRFSDAGIDGVIVLISAFQFMDKDAKLDTAAFQ